MTKICLRLLFVAAAALPLVHGCSDSSLQCLGTAVACADRELDDCSHGCEVHSGCYGEAPVTCDSLTDNPTLCLQTPGCRYVGSCDGAEGCSQKSYDDCATAPGCQQVRRCYGDGTTCDKLEQSQCDLYSQCEFGSQCSGKAIACADLDSEVSCNDVPGCFPANTKAAVVSAAGK
jgi:hypothetical protein